jgi:hypothetical protein
VVLPSGTQGIDSAAPTGILKAVGCVSPKPCEGGVVVQQHAMALGYFLLAIFCVFTSATCESLNSLNFRLLIAPLWLAAMLAVWAGFMFLLRAFGVYPLKTFWNLLLVAQQPPVRQSRFKDEHTA